MWLLQNPARHDTVVLTSRRDGDYGTEPWLKSLQKLYEIEEIFPEGDRKELWKGKIIFKTILSTQILSRWNNFGEKTYKLQNNWAIIDIEIFRKSSISTNRKGNYGCITNLNNLFGSYWFLSSFIKLGWNPHFLMSHVVKNKFIYISTSKVIVQFSFPFPNSIFLS